MTLPADLPVVDHHCHLSPGGEGVEAARRFSREGGTHLFLTTHNWNHRALRSVDDYRAQFESIESLGRRIQTDTPVSTILVVAPYPIDLLGMADAIGLPATIEVQMQALDLAGQWVREHRAVALGEVGWPHFPIPEDQRAAAQQVFRHALEVARDVGCPAVVHCEDLTAEGYKTLGELARTAGVPAERVVKHYARTYVPSTERSGVTPSFLARKEGLASALDDQGPWFFETDFLDDPKRPGAVLDIATVPRRVAAILRDHPEREERLRIPFVDSVRKLYGFTPERRTEDAG
ncbi:MAG: TatD family hydrolase [Thermoplasmata archaeon]|nr:TatD family hydrolase [Thermoplasmata archaeon]